MKTFLPLLVVVLCLFAFVDVAHAEGDNVDEAYIPDGCVMYSLGLCVPGYISSDTWWTPAPEHMIGKAVWYAPWIMRATAEYRGMNLDGFVGGVSLMSPADIGQTVWLKRPGLSWEGPFLVVDCAARQDFWVVVSEIKEVVEVDFATALRWGMVSGNKMSYSINAWMTPDVEVYKGLMPPVDDAEPIVYDEFLRQTVQWGGGVYRNWTYADTEAMQVTDFDSYMAQLTDALAMDSRTAYDHMAYAKYGGFLDDGRENGIQGENLGGTSDLRDESVSQHGESAENSDNAPNLSCPLSGCEAEAGFRLSEKGIQGGRG